MWICAAFCLCLSPTSVTATCQIAKKICFPRFCLTNLILRFVYLLGKVWSSLRKEHDHYLMLILLKLYKNPVFVTLWVQKLVSNYIFCARWKKKLFWRYKLWLSWKQCVILAWHSHTWVAQTCESAKQTTRIASAVTIWERSWTLSIFYSLKSGHMVEPPLHWCNPQTGLSGSILSRLPLKRWRNILSQMNQEH